MGRKRPKEDAELWPDSPSDQSDQGPTASWAEAVHLDEVRCTKTLPGHVGCWGSLRHGVNALDSSSCAKLAWASRGAYHAVREAAALRIVLGLGQGCIKTDLASQHLANPVLALSHLESLANSPFLFDSLRGLLRCLLESCKDDSSAILLEAPPENDRLCDLLCEHVLEMDAWSQDGPTGEGGDAVLNAQLRASTVARLASLMYQYTPPDEVTMLEGMLSQIMAPARHLKVDAASILERGGAAAQLVHGLPNLLPATRTFRSLASKTKKVPAAKLICQLVERLLFPSAEASIILQLSLPVDRAVSRQLLHGQTTSFMHNLHILQGEVWKDPDNMGSLDILVIQAKKCYILVFENFSER